MAREFISEYGLDPENYIQQFITTATEELPELTEQPVEEVLFVDSGPVEFLIWFALKDYDSHTFFYKDTDPDATFLRQLLMLSPQRDDMPQFKQFLNQHYDVYRELSIARLVSIPDVYQPKLGTRPRANLGICFDPESDQIVSGISGTPRSKEESIFEHMDKIVPDKSLERFVNNTVRTVNSAIEAEADRHTIEGDLRPELEPDPDFHHETTKPLPTGIHPKYTDTPAELWQKPASKVPFMEGSQGFLQLWVPTDDSSVTLVSATAGDYDRAAVVDAIRDTYQQRVL